MKKLLFAITALMLSVAAQAQTTDSEVLDVTRKAILNTSKIHRHSFRKSVQGSILGRQTDLASWQKLPKHSY